MLDIIINILFGVSPNTVVAGFAVGALLVAATGLKAGSVLTTVITGIITTGLQFGVSLLTKKKPQTPSFTTPVNNPEYRVTKREPVSNYRTVYGRSIVGGSITFIETSTSQKTLYMALVLAHHGIEEITKGYLDKEEFYNTSSGFTPVGRFNGAMGLEHTKLGGSSNNTVSALMLTAPSWTSSMYGKGIAWFGLNMVADPDVFPNGMPGSITFDIKGKKILDVRTSTTAWSDNPALVLYDFLTTSRPVGPGLSTDLINTSSFEDAADICDELVDLKGGGTEKRYTFNGPVEADGTLVSDIVESILESMAGIMVVVNGKLTLYAGAYRAPSVTITDDDLYGPATFTWTIPKEERITRVDGLFFNINGEAKEAEAYPTQVSTSLETKYGTSFPTNLDLPYTISHTMAQRIATIHMRQTQKPIRGSIILSPKYLDVSAGDIIHLELSEFSIDSDFLVTTASINATANNLQIELGLQQYGSDIYEWDEAVDELSASTSLEVALPPIAANIAPGEITLDSITYDDPLGYRSIQLTGGFGSYWTRTAVGNIHYRFSTPRNIFVSSVAIEISGGSYPYIRVSATPETITVGPNNFSHNDVLRVTGTTLEDFDSASFVQINPQLFVANHSSDPEKVTWSWVPNIHYAHIGLGYRTGATVKLILRDNKGGTFNVPALTSQAIAGDDGDAGYSVVSPGTSSERIVAGGILWRRANGTQITVNKSI